MGDHRLPPSLSGRWRTARDRTCRTAGIIMTRPDDG
jgi:hypothetical protein